MSKKGPSTETSHDDQQTTKYSDGELLMKAVFQNEEEEDIAERVERLAIFSGKVDREFVALDDVSSSADPSELPPHDNDDDDDDDDDDDGNDDEMSKKRSSSESSHDDDQTTKDSGGELMQAVFQNEEEDNTKRATLTSVSDTTLEDLPMELIVHILVKAVAMEVKGMRMAKGVWKEKADLVISRLRSVSLKWNNILSIDFFRNELNRALDGFAQETLRWEVVLHQPPTDLYIMSLATIRDEVFVLFRQQGGRYVLNVYDRNNLAQPKDVIPIPEFDLVVKMAACNVSNCVYLLGEDFLNGLSVKRISKDEHQFKVSTWIEHLRLPIAWICARSSGLSVSAQGNLVIITSQRYVEPVVYVCIDLYDANGLVQHKIKFYPDPYVSPYVSSVIQKADGNLVVSCFDILKANVKLVEIDTSGRIIREYQSSHNGDDVTSFEDIYGRILVHYSRQRIELLDSEFNLMDTTVPHLDDGRKLNLFHLIYNGDRHEMMAFRYYLDTSTRTQFSVLATLRFKDE